MILFSSLWSSHQIWELIIKQKRSLPSHCDFFVFRCRISFLVGLSLFFVSCSSISCDAGVSVRRRSELVPLTRPVACLFSHFMSRELT